MKTRKMLVILVLVLGLMVCQAEVSEAAEMGTAFTYQGHLYDSNHVANGLYQFEFKLYDAAAIGGIQQGSTVTVGDVNVIDGYFTVELDFGGGVFDGFARWLEVGVRPGELEDPNEYTTLWPRQEVTPTPYALYAGNAGADNDWTVSMNDMYSIPSGNVGIGTSGPGAKLEVIQDSWANILKVGLLTSPNRLILSSGHAWASLSGGTTNRDDIVIQHSTGNVGIGTTGPEATLDVTNSGGKPAIEASSSWIGVKGTHSSTSGSFPGVWGATDSLSPNATGVRGIINSTAPGSGSSGVRGINNGTNSRGAGVLGSHAGGGNGVQGTSVSGNAVLGQSDSGYGVFGVSQSDIGVIGISQSGTKPAGAFFGGVSIGMYTIPTGISLAVDGKILCEEVEVQLSEDWPDYVFEQDYELMPLEKLGQYVREKKHLPDMTTADEVASSGISLGQAQTQMLRKIEELTLYVVDLNQQLSNVRQENKSLQNRITALERK